MDLKNCMLTPSLRKLIEVCHMLETTNTKVIANHLNRSPATIRTEFQRILQIMNVHSRFAAVKIAQNNGWLNTQAIYRRRHDDSRDNGLAEHSKKTHRRRYDDGPHGSEA